MEYLPTIFHNKLTIHDGKYTHPMSTGYVGLFIYPSITNSLCIATYTNGYKLGLPSNNS